MALTTETVIRSKSPPIPRNHEVLAAEHWVSGGRYMEGVGDSCPSTATKYDDTACQRVFVDGNEAAKP